MAGEATAMMRTSLGVLTLQKLLEDVVLVLGEGIRVVGGQGKSHGDNYKLNGKE